MTVNGPSHFLTCLEAIYLDYLQVDFLLFLALLSIRNDCELINISLSVGQAPLLTSLFRGFTHQLLLVDQ